MADGKYRCGQIGQDGKACGRYLRINFDQGMAYEGNFVGNLADGAGRSFESNADFYEGQYRAGKPHGYGVYIYHEGGNQYEGYHADGKANGFGTMRRSDGTVLF